MIKNIRKYLEYLFFILVNIFLWMPVYSKILNNTWNISTYVSIHIFKANPLEIEMVDDPTALILSILFFLIFLLAKPFLFHYLYIFKMLFPNIHRFFDKLRTNNKFLLSILGITFILDLISFIFFKNIWSFFGLTFNYVLFLLFFQPTDKNNVNPDGTVIMFQSLFIKIISFIILIPVFLIIIFLNLIILYLLFTRFFLY